MATPGLPDTMNHISDIKKGYIDMKYEYVHGLKFPGDLIVKILTS